MTESTLLKIESGQDQKESLYSDSIEAKLILLVDIAASSVECEFIPVE
ncbi:hypothetical protein [Vibrio sp. SCSIO 43137]|nr:hypothetical protein [Vibrio sp. SCSIO 43137]WCE31304.1 hypothetical protein PK654_06830 [Vibrio sp. SCSIO 43137]